MELKDYLRILVRRWPWMVASALIVAALLWGVSLWQAVPYYATMEVHFRKTPLELGFFEPEDYAFPFSSNQARAQMFTHSDVLERASKRLEERKIRCSPQELRGLVTVTPSGIEGTYLVRVDHSNPAYPKAILTALYDAYLDHARKEYDDTFDSALARTEAEAKEVKQELDDLAVDLGSVDRIEGVYDVEIQGQIMGSLIVDLERQRQQNRLDLTKIDRQLQSVSSDEKHLAEDELLRHHLPPYTYTGAELTESSKRMRELEAQLRSLQRKYTETHPTIQAIYAELSEIQEAIAAELKTAAATKAAGLLDQKATLESSYELLGQILQVEYEKLSRLRKFRTDQAAIVRKVEAAVTRQEKISDQRRKLVESKEKSGERVKHSMVQQRTPSDAIPVPVTRRVSLPLVLLIAVIVGVATGFLIDYLADTLRTSSDVKAHLNLPTIASLPYVSDEPISLLQAATKSPVYEVYNKLAVFLDSLIQEKRAKTLLVTSTKAEEGKTTVSSNVAIALAQTGRRVILVDSDIRKPQVHMLFGLDNSRGLSTILSGEYGAEEELRRILDQGDGAGIEGYLQRTPVENLRAITAGPVAPNPIHLLKSDTMQWLLNELKTRADIVIFDSPPLMGVIDAAVLASMVELTVVVVAENAVKRTEAAQMKHALNQVGANIVGAVINKSRSRPEAYYYYYYRYRGYGQE